MPHDVCPNCGAELSFKEADICWKCGFRIKPLPEGTVESDQRAMKIAVGFMILPVVTVIIAGIIAAIVFGMAGGVERTKPMSATASVAATAVKTQNGIFVTWQGGRDNGLVSSYKVTLNGNRPVDGIPPLVGKDVRVGNSTQEYDHVVVVADLRDGSEMVVLDTYV
ncbi:MAG TPA: type IV pilin [Methanomicrobiales archaeon]|nr:type IV pilin [Methanomicrobiales archaeon]